MKNTKSKIISDDKPKKRGRPRKDSLAHKKIVGECNDSSESETELILNLKHATLDDVYEDKKPTTKNTKNKSKNTVHLLYSDDENEYMKPKNESVVKKDTRTTNVKSYDMITTKEYRSTKFNFNFLTFN